MTASPRIRMRPTHRGHRGGTLMGALVALAVGCGSTDGASAPDDAAALRDRDFLLQSSEGFQPVAGSTVRVFFRENEAGFHGGCNSHGGHYQLSDGVLSFSSLDSTAIGCSAALMEQDDWLAAFMTARPRLTLVGDDLTLRSSAATLVFRDRVVADPDRPLVGTPWTVLDHITGGTATAYSLADKPTLAFGADGRVTVETTCNTGDGAFIAEGAKVTLNGMHYTTGPCDGLRSVVDQHLRAVLADGELTVKIVAARLTLMRGEVGVTAAAP